MPERSFDESRWSDSQAYASRIRMMLTASNTTPIIILTTVGTPLARYDDACCPPASPSTEQLSHVTRLYVETDLSALFPTVTNVAFGCGNQFRLPIIQPEGKIKNEPL